MTEIKEVNDSLIGSIVRVSATACGRVIRVDSKNGLGLLEFPDGVHHCFKILGLNTVEENKREQMTLFP